jgi:hypothetical protein
MDSTIRKRKMYEEFLSKVSVLGMTNQIKIFKEWFFVFD